MSTVLAVVCIAAKAFSCQPMDVRVIDGDTIQIRQERIRFEGVDAPEMKGLCEAESSIARIAKERVEELIRGNKVTVERHGLDKYRRTLAAVSVEGGDIGDILLSEGLARKWERKWRPGLDDVWCQE